jgi:class 3 adenylate cyclase/tetratricopeptide (TPR) repeat protein
MVKCPSCGEENPPKFRLCGYCGSTLAAAPPALPVRELRKTVTIIFSDLKGSTALGETLDTEAMHEVKERYFKAMAAQITRHGGKIEKYIGDAIMAVFGLPQAHEDDALRAVRAVHGMQGELERLNVDLRARYGIELANRTGVNTGEVVANDDPTADQKLATGDAVNVAARLEQAAPVNHILLGEVTWRLVRDAVEVEAVEPLELKGKAQKVAAYRLVSAKGLDGNVRRVDTPIVGRDDELARIAAVYRDVIDGAAVRMVTVVGDAGVGKSRLVHEVVERIAAGARILRGRCLAYGEGITFWPLRSMLTDAGIREDDSPEAARHKLMHLIRDADVVDRLASAIGLNTSSYPLHEVYWAARKVLEILAAHGPVVALVDDIHWAEPAFLDLLDHVLSTTTGAPILLLTTSRHDLLEERPQWGQQAGASNVVLSPLDASASAQVVDNLLGHSQLPADVLERIVFAAEGNPLYVEQVLSMMIDGGVLRSQDGRWVRADDRATIDVPPTIHALLGARLDKLGRAERAAVEPAAVIGLEFDQQAVRSLAPEILKPAIGEHLKTLTRKQFIRLARAIEAEPIYRFSHQMVRDTVYNGLLKRARANLHIEFVRWSDRLNADRDRALEFEEILGYHLEQAYRYLKELGPLDETGIEVGRDGARRLRNAGQRALERGDMHAAGNLFQRTLALLDASDPLRRQTLPEYAETLLNLGRFDDARSVLDECDAVAARLGDSRTAAQSKLLRLYAGLYSGELDDWSAQTQREVEALMPGLELDEAHSELAMAWRLIMLAHGNASRFSLAGDAAERALHHATLAGSARLSSKIGGFLSSTAPIGAVPVVEAIEQCEQILDSGLSDRQIVCGVTCALAQLRAMNGELDAARQLYRGSRVLLRELGQGVNAASTALDVALVELHGGDLAAAENEVRSDYAFLERSGETYFLSSLSALLARLVRDQGRDEEALEWSRTAEAKAAEGDVMTQAMWRSVRAPILARAGQIEEAREMAAAAITLLEKTEAPGFQADAWMEAAAVLRLAGDHEAAREATQRAHALYAAKGDRYGAARAAAAVKNSP